jgi:WD40 repeat protein
MNRRTPAPDQGAALSKTVTLSDEAPRSASCAVSLELPVVDPDRFTVYGEHARGGLGRILAADDLRLGRPVAVKELLQENPESTRRFLREVRTTARLQHPAIVPVYDAGRWPAGKMFYSMKLVSGRSLKAVIAGTTTLDERLALLPHLISVAEAIGYAHSKRIVHRDLKPSNVMIGEFGETVVIDWGLAKDLDEKHLSQRTGDGPFRTVPDENTVVGAVLGTPAYMPPEQAAGSEIDERADVYAFGAMLYHTLAGVPPHSGSSAAATLEKVLAGPPLSLERREPAVPRDLATIVAKSMARARDDRYRNGSAIADDLRRFQTGQLVGAHRYSRGTLAARWLRRHRAAVSVGMVLLGILTVAMVLSVRRIIQERNSARAERAVARQRAHALTLTQARTSLAVDPTATIGWIKSYPTDGAEQSAARVVAADAAGRGLARYVLRATHNVLGAAWSPDGSTVVAGGEAEGLSVWTLPSGTAHSLPFRTTTHFIAYSPDGQTLVASGEYGRLAMWRGAARVPRELVGQHDMIFDIVFSRDGRSLLSVDSAHRVCWWDVASPTCSAVDFAEASSVLVGFGADGTPLAVVAHGRDVEVWDVRARRELARLRNAAKVDEVATATAAGTVVVLAAGRLLVWDLRRAARVDEVPQRGRVAGFVVSKDGRRLAIWYDDRTVIVRDLDHGKSHTLDQPQRTFAAVFSEDGEAVAVGSVGGAITVWDVDRDTTQTFLGHTGVISHIAFSSDGRALISCGNEDHTVRMWRRSDATRQILRGEPGLILNAAFSSDGKRLATASSGGIARVWDVSSGRSEKIERHDDLVQDVSFSPDDRWLASASWDGTATWTNLADGRSGVLRHGARVQRVRWLPGARELATASMDGAISVWSIPGGERQILGRHVGPVSRLALSPDGSSLLTAGDDATIRVWDLKTRTGRVVGRHDHGVNRVAFFPDGRSVVSASEDGSVRIWEIASGRWRALREGGSKLSTVVVSPDGGTIAAAGEDGAIYVWDRAGAKPPRVLRLHAAAVRNLAFSPDGRLLTSTGYDHTVGIWSAASGAVARLHGHEGNVISAVFSPDGRTLATTSADATVRLWAVDAIDLAPDGEAEFRRWLASTTNFAIPTSSEQAEGEAAR